MSQCPPDRCHSQGYNNSSFLLPAAADLLSRPSSPDLLSLSTLFHHALCPWRLPHINRLPCLQNSSCVWSMGNIGKEESSEVYSLVPCQQGCWPSLHWRSQLLSGFFPHTVLSVSVLLLCPLGPKEVTDTFTPNSMLQILESCTISLDFCMTCLLLCK